MFNDKIFFWAHDVSYFCCRVEFLSFFFFTNYICTQVALLRELLAFQRDSITSTAAFSVWFHKATALKLQILCTTADEGASQSLSIKIKWDKQSRRKLPAVVATVSKKTAQLFQVRRRWSTLMWLRTSWREFLIVVLRFWIAFCCTATCRVMPVDCRKLAGCSSAWRWWRPRWRRKTTSSPPSRPQLDQADLRLWLTFTKWHQMSSNTRCSTRERR